GGEEVLGPFRVDGVELREIAGFDESGDVDDGIDPGNRRVERSAILDGARRELNPWDLFEYLLLGARPDQRPHGVALGRKALRHVGAQKARCPGHEHAHRGTLAERVRTRDRKRIATVLPGIVQTLT